MKLVISKPFISSGVGDNATYAVDIFDLDREETIGNGKRAKPRKWMVACIWGKIPEEATTIAEQIVAVLQK